VSRRGPEAKAAQDLLGRIGLLDASNDANWSTGGHSTAGVPSSRGPPTGYLASDPSYLQSVRGETFTAKREERSNVPPDASPPEPRQSCCWRRGGPPMVGRRVRRTPGRCQEERGTRTDGRPGRGPRRTAKPSAAPDSALPLLGNGELLMPPRLLQVDCAHGWAPSTGSGQSTGRGGPGSWRSPQAAR